MNWFTVITNLFSNIFAGRLKQANNSMGSQDAKISGMDDNTSSTYRNNSAIFDESRIQQDYSVVEKWHSGWKRSLEDITEVVIHHTDGTGTIDSLRKWMLEGERKEQYTKGISLFHFAIGKDGLIWKAGPISRWWYHSCSGQHDRFTIGIENIHKSGEFSEEQYSNLFWLLFEYMPHFCTSYYRIVSHDYNFQTYSNRKKGCPGPDFDWSRLEDEMKRRNIIFEKHKPEEYTIKFPV